MGSLFLITLGLSGLYCIFLEWLKHHHAKAEADWTWIEVIGGAIVVGIGPYLLEATARITTAAASRIAHWVSFITAMIPVAGWQVWRMHRRHVQMFKIAQDEAYGKTTTPTLANPRALVSRGKRRAGGGNNETPRPRNGTD